MKTTLNLMLVALLTALVGCGQQPPAASPNASQNTPPDKLAFLDTQQKPLLLDDVNAHLGHLEMGSGPFYSYRPDAGGKTDEFWMRPPPAPAPGATPPAIAPVQIVFVVERPDQGQPQITWPPDMKGSDVDAAIASAWPKN